MVMTTPRHNKRQFVGETTALHVPFTAVGPIGITVAGTFGAGSVSVLLECGDGFAASSETTWQEAVAKKIELASGDTFKLQFSSCTDVDATLTFFSVIEQ